MAVLGDMRELGPEERLLHRQTGEYAAAAGVKLLWGVGTLSESTIDGFRDACAGVQAGHVASPAETSPIEASLRPGDVVLFKASRGVKLEQMVDRVADQARAGRWAGGSEGDPGATGRGSGPQE